MIKEDSPLQITIAFSFCLPPPLPPAAAIPPHTQTHTHQHASRFGGGGSSCPTGIPLLRLSDFGPDQMSTIDHRAPLTFE